MWVFNVSYPRRRNNVAPMVRYNFRNVKTLLSPLLVACVLISVGFAEETAFHRVLVPDSKGNAVKAILTFSDQNKAIQIEPVKGGSRNIPYGEIDKFSYEYTKKHHVSEKTIATAPLGVGTVNLIRRSTSHWLRIDYHEQDLPRTYVLRMDKHNYLRILEAVKTHTGKDAEILGNADKRKK